MSIGSERIQQLVRRFNAGEASSAEISQIESLIGQGLINIDDLQPLSGMQAQVQMLETPTPSPQLDSSFYELLSAENRKQQVPAWKQFFSWPELAPRLSLATMMLIAGIFIGYFLNTSDTGPRDQQIEMLSQQVSDLQEMMMLSLLETGSATERLKAVGLTQEMDEASKKVTSALIQTLNGDENVNVRLAALEALKPYAADSSVREALIRAIGRQESPLVQISLAELMVALQEKAAVKEFEKLVESDSTPAEVKDKLKKSIEVLI